MRPMGPAPMMTTTPPGRSPLTASRGAAAVRLADVQVVGVRRDDAGDRLGDGGVRRGEVAVRQRQQAAGRQDLGSDEDVLRQKPRQRVAHGDLGHTAAAVAVALEDA